jgi:hypothetical protein
MTAALILPKLAQSYSPLVTSEEFLFAKDFRSSERQAQL